MEHGGKQGKPPLGLLGGLVALTVTLGNRPANARGGGQSHQQQQPPQTSPDFLFPLP